MIAKVVLVCLFIATLCTPFGAAAGDKLADLPAQLEAKTPERQIEMLRGYLADGLVDARIHFFLGNAFYSSEQFDSAIVHFKKATELDREYSKAYVNMGIVYDATGDHQNAQAAYKWAVQINPEDVLAYCHLGFLYQSQNDLDAAIKCYKKALSIDPNSAQAHYNMGLLFAEAKIFNEALIEWNKVIELNPEGGLGKIAAENVQLIKTYMELDE